MKSIRLLHVTDFHFGKESEFKNTADLKDGTVPKKLTSNLNSDWSEEFFRCLSEWTSANHIQIDSIICTGDIGDKGLPNNVEMGASFLELLCTRLELDKSQLFLCPGNHDLQREKTKTEFKVYEDKLKKYSITNYSTYDNVYCTKIKGIPLVSINSCLGGTSKSDFSVKFKNILKNISDEDKNIITDELESLGQEYLNDFLDVPAIGNKQLDECLSYITSQNSDSAIVLMHHNPVPNNSVEIRPYSSMVDSGKFITKLLHTKRNTFILHGHTHFDYDILSYFPNGDDNYVSAIGCGALNDSASSRANIYEFYFDENNLHIITRVFRVKREGAAAFGVRHSHNVYDKGFSKYDAPVLTVLAGLSNSISFTELLKKLKDEDVDDISLILRVILRYESLLINLDKRNSDDYNNWLIIKKKS